MDKDKLIKAEETRLRKLFKGLESAELANRLIEEIAFITVELQSLKRIIIAEGSVTTYQNGPNQSGITKHPAFTNYINGLKQYSSLIKQLNDMLPEEEIDEDNELIQFLKNRK